jgi:hypothetical protein
MAISVPIVTSFKNDGIQKATRSLEGFARRTGELAKNVALGVAGIAAGVGAAAFGAVQAAADIEESLSKVNVVFGEGADNVTAFAETAATQFGLSKQAVLDAAGTFGTFGKAAGLSGDDLATFSNDFTALAADLASFNNTTPEEAITAIGAALRGENEPIRRFGVLIDDARLRARALELGIYDGTGALDAQQKVLAAQAEIWAQTGDAQGDFSRTSDGLANKQRILRAQFSNVVATIGQKLLPIALKIADFFSTRVIPVIERVADAFSKDGLAGVIGVLLEEFRKALPGIRSFLWELVQTIGNWVVNVGWPWLKEKFPIWGRGLIDWIKDNKDPALTQLWIWLTAVGNWARDTALPWLREKAAEWGGALVDWVGENIGPALEALGEWLTEVGDWVINDALPEFGKNAELMAQKFAEWTGKLLPKVIPALTEFVFKLGVWIVTKAVPKMNELGVQLAVGLATGFLQGLKDAGILKYLGPVGFVLDKFIDPTPPTPPAPIGSGTDLDGLIRTSSLLPTGRQMTGDVYNINVQGALDPNAVARQIRSLLTDSARRDGRTAVIAPVIP